MPKEVDIHLKTVGAQQAAQEVDKVEKELGQLESQAQRADAALDGVAASAGAASTGAGVSAPGRRRRRKGAAQGVKELAQESGKASQSTGMLGQKATQVGYQVQDLAVQIQGGTSALTAFAQQGSQLLGIFGPGGALAGALLAVGAMAAQIFMRVREGGDDSAESIEELTEQAKKLAEELGNAAEARAIESVRQWIDSLTDEEAAVERVNAALDRNLKLMQERRRRQAEEESAQDALDLATIDADPNMSEEEKIRARAMISQRAAGRRTASRIAEIGDEVTTAQTRAGRAGEAVERASGDTNLARAELISRKEEEEGLEKRRLAADDAKRQVDKLSADLEKATSGRRQLQAALAQGPPSEGGEQALREAQAEIDDIRRRLDDAKKEIEAFTPEDAVRLDALGGADGEGEISELEKRLGELEERERQLREEANKAGAERDLIVANANEEVASLRRRQELDIKAREITTDATVRELRTRDEEKAKRDQEAEERRRQSEQERIERQAAATGGTQATAAARSLGAPDRAVRQIEALGMAMQSDPSAANLERFEKMLEQLLAFAERKNEADSAAAEKVRRLEARVESLRLQQAKLRDGR